MLAACYEGDHRVSVRERERAAPGPGEVQLEVAYSGICGTDMHILHGEMDTRVSIPAILGHEMSGTVAALGDGVAGWASGDRVVVMPLDWCGSSAACRHGYSHICHRLNFLGIDSPGALQSFWNVPERVLVPVPAGLGTRQAALAEPTAVAVHDVRRAGLRPGERALVVGGGPIGVLIASVAVAAGAEVLVSETSPERRELVAGLGLRAADPVTEDLDAIVEAWTGGEGVERQLRGLRVGRRPRRCRVVALGTRPPYPCGYPLRSDARQPAPVLLAGAQPRRRTCLRAHRLRGGAAPAPLRSDPGRLADHRCRSTRRGSRRVYAARGRPGDEGPHRLHRAGAMSVPPPSRVAELFDLSGKLAVVTGVRRGIGLAIAEVLAAAGADIVGVSAAARGGSLPTSSSCRVCGRSFEAIRADLADSEQLHELAERLAAGARPVDILVNNAGTIARAPVADHGDDLWEAVIATNLTAPFVLTREIGRGMVERGAGKVIFTVSLLAFQGGILVPGYAASKHGVAGSRQGVLQRVGAEGRQRERHCAGLYRHGQHRGSCGRTPSGADRSSTASRLAGGAPRRTSPAQHCSLHPGV